jgi:dTDP-glucose 4,6-dehydratase
MSKILVTGAYGFIGANFLKFLLESTEHEVINVDSCTYAANLTYLADLRKQHRGKRYHYQYGDISQFKDICSIIFYTKPDIIINFAAQTHVDNSIAAPIPFVSTNITGTFNLLECARLLPVQKFIQVSTDEVYGMLVGEYQPPFKETDILKPSSVYSASKAAADLLALSYYKTYKLPICVTRCCNNFGIKRS